MPPDNRPDDVDRDPLPVERQAARTAALRDFIRYALAQTGVRFMRRLDIAKTWIAAFGKG